MFSRTEANSAAAYAEPREPVLAAWFVSLVLHFASLVSLGLWVDSGSPADRSHSGERVRHGEIVLVQRQRSESRYLQAASFQTESSPASPEAPPPALLPLPELAGPQLPALPAAIAQAEIPTASSAPVGSGPPSGAGHATPRQAETQLFGLKARGSRFVYVIDRSASMADFGGRPLAAAKRELAASLAPLAAVHQFQIVFYNERPELMSLARGQPPQMVFADDRGKHLAGQFVGGIYAHGGTEHLAALALALRMQPDVVFLLTDADPPRLSSDDLDRIQRWNRGTVIHTVEFGVGPPQPGDNFLRELAEQSAGQYTYVDVTRLER